MLPQVRQIGGRREFYWEDARVLALVSRISEHHDRITAEVEFRTDLEGLPPHLYQTQLNLLSLRSKKELARELGERFPSPDWEAIIEQLCVLSLRLHREGEPVKELRAQDEIPEPKFLIHPLIYERKPNLFYGEGGTGKSILALSLALCIQLHPAENPLGVEVKKQARTLILDYECDEEETRKRLSLLLKGLGLPEPELPVFYRECTLPFVEDAPKIEEIVSENRIDFLIIDSLGVAAGSQNLNEAATATAFFSALRRLKVTSLIITHTSKESLERKKTSPFGSVYFANLSRNIFEVRLQQEAGEWKINIALFHRKNNQGPLFPPLGFEITFEDDRIKVESAKVQEIPEFLEYLSTKQKMIEFLRSEGKATAREIAEAIGASEMTVKVTLSRNKKIFTRLERGEWGLLL